MGTAAAAALMSIFGRDRLKKRQRSRKNNDPPPRPASDPLGGKSAQVFHATQEQYEEIMSALRHIQTSVDESEIRAEADRQAARVHRDRQIEELREIRQIVAGAIQRWIDSVARER